MAATTLTATVRYTPPGIRQYYVLTTMAGAAPTRTELDAGTDITSEVVDGGVSGFTLTPSTVDAGDVGTKITKKAVGRTALPDSSIALFLSEDGTDARTLFSAGETVYIVIFPEGDHPTTHKMDVWPVKVQEVSIDQDTTKVAQFTTSFAHFQVPNRNVAVPAS